ncbi:hypothetical protein [Streptacidiphilus cavernicola]|uniref:Uncharacterized protein n=1 Tax=Streptacidiphilus cavernicola TaxID=3342716 RepID=A0ABV6VS46_9ACTN
MIAHWQYAGTGLLPELAHLADLLAAAPQPRADRTAHPLQARRADDRAGHTTGPATGTVAPAEASA